MYAYVGQTMSLRFAFHSDGATIYPGVYVDYVVIAEPLQTQLYISTTSPLPDVYVDQFYSQQMLKVGGTSVSLWTITSSVNAEGWLTLDENTGGLRGTPKAGDVGPVSVTIRVYEPDLTSNFDEKTFTF